MALKLVKARRVAKGEAIPPFAFAWPYVDCGSHD
jgi:hypothetical protein